MESGFESQISEQKSTLAEKENKIEQILKEKSKLEEKSAALQNKLDQSNLVIDFVSFCRLQE
jgi:predicted nuclease with TOPRIM domain